MIDTQAFRDKYAQRENSRGVMFTPVGGADVMRLCDAVDQLILLVRDLQADANIDVFNAVEQQLWRI